MTCGKSIALFAAVLGATGCLAEEPNEVDCSSDRCDAVQTRDELLAALEGKNDPIADMFRNLASDSATLSGDYNTVLDELGEIVGCDSSTERSFVVLSNADFIPKTVFARCADSPQAASRFFVAAPAARGDDMDARALHLSGWDEDAKQYRHYATNPSADGEMNINVEPTFCLGCHGGPEKLDIWQPLMNEMTNPWSGWNAEPGFRSQLFDDFLDGAIANGETYVEMLAPGRIDSASNLEPLVRSAIARTVGARVLERSQLASVSSALDLLRPLFCDETVNYVSEVHSSGEIRLDAFVDEGLRDLLTIVDTTSIWSWRGESSIHLAPLAEGELPVTLIATRATISVELERAFRSRSILSPAELLRARSLDWQQPFGSEQRCSLYRDGRARIEAGELETLIDALSPEATSEQLIAPFYNEILRDVAPLGAADIQALGEAVNERITAVAASGQRTALREERDRRGCWAKEHFLAAPIIPDLSCR